MKSFSRFKKKLIRQSLFNNFTLTFLSGKQRRNGALVPNSDEQCPRQHDQNNGDNVSSLRHLRGQDCAFLWRIKHMKLSVDIIEISIYLVCVYIFYQITIVNLFLSNLSSSAFMKCVNWKTLFNVKTPPTVT